MGILLATYAQLSLDPQFFQRQFSPNITLSDVPLFRRVYFQSIFWPSQTGQDSIVPVIFIAFFRPTDDHNTIQIEHKKNCWVASRERERGRKRKKNGSIKKLGQEIGVDILQVGCSRSHGVSLVTAENTRAKAPFSTKTLLILVWKGKSTTSLGTFLRPVTGEVY